jgi:UDP-N-acetylglucosamine--N-acetylmuramyl-(pentapeptide) pyrophosphoryl-undecaprenol N-acetylglucosamine transferase
MSDPMTIFLAGGGTGGHLYPGISVAQSLREILPEAKLLFLCTEREIDTTILTPTGFEFLPQPIVPPVKTVGGLLKFWSAWRATKDMLRKLFRERRPAAVLGLGGYAAGVAVKMASNRKIPAAILNPDVIPGKANQYLLKYVQAVCCQFEQTSRYIPSNRKDKIKITGCPIRADMRSLPPRADAAKRLGLDPLLQTLVITGASQGAATVNDAAIATLTDIKLQGWQILHLSGKDHAAAVRQRYHEADLAAAVVDFTPAMADVWAVADLAISRAGASSCAELTACGIPSILMPYPFHKDMHQRANAKVLVDSGAALLVTDKKDAAKNKEKLRPAIESLIYDVPKRQSMSIAAKSLGKADAADQVAQVVRDIVLTSR